MKGIIAKLMIIWAILQLQFSPQSFAETTYSIKLESIGFNYNNSVGNDWGFSATANGKQIRYQETVFFNQADLPVRLTAQATEYDTYSDHGSSSEMVTASMFNESVLTINVVVREDRGRYAGNTASLTYRFRLNSSDNENTKNDIDGSSSSSSLSYIERAINYNDSRISQEKAREIRLFLIENEYIDTDSDDGHGEDFILAIINYQKANGLVADGMIGPITQKSLDSAIERDSTVTVSNTPANDNDDSVDTIVKANTSSNDTDASFESFPSSQPSNQDFFSIGSSKYDVKRVQGEPDSVIGDTWFYSYSTVVFSQDKVSGWSDSGGNLNVFIGNPITNAPKISLGSSYDQVIDSMGTPRAIIGDTWFYGYSNIVFSQGQVSGWSDSGGNLNVFIGNPITNAPKISLGSSYDQVIDSMGTPRAIIGDTWFYGSSSLHFSEGKVSSWSDYSNTLNLND